MQTHYPERTIVYPSLEEKPSGIHRVGIFSTQFIPKDTRIMTCGGEAVSREDAFSGKYRSKSIWPITRDIYLALPKTDTQPSIDEALNHSCDPNTWLVDAYTLTAWRDIHPNEEITVDQGTWNFEDDGYTDDFAPCACGSASCRGVLTKEDWKRTDVQDAYAGHFHPIIQEMIEGST